MAIIEREDLMQAYPFIRVHWRFEPQIWLDESG